MPFKIVLLGCTELRLEIRCGGGEESYGDRNIQQSAIGIQPAQHFGAVPTGILPSQVAESKGSQQSGASTTTGLKFNRIEQDGDVDAGEARVQESEGKTKSGTQRPTLAKIPQSGASPQGGAPSSFVTPHAPLSYRWVAFANIGNTR
jgi:hypothetical protein